jgi:hypothetical protein
MQLKECPGRTCTFEQEETVSFFPDCSLQASFVRSLHLLPMRTPGRLTEDPCSLPSK